MSRCRFCDHVNPAGADHCEQCGTWIDPDLQATEPPPLARAESLPDELVERLRSLLDNGQKIEAIRVYREATGTGLREAKDAVEALDRPSPEGSDTEFRDELLHFLKQRQPIQAIKLYRDRTGAGLKESKDAVDELARRHGLTPSGQGKGCAGAIVLILGTGSVLSVLRALVWMS